MIFVTRSTPFCTPAAQQARPTAHTTSIQKMSSPGLASMPPNTAATPSTSCPTNAPLALLYT